MNRSTSGNTSFYNLLRLDRLVVAVSALVFVACGGGSGSSAPPSSANSAPVFTGATNFTFQENQNIEFSLSATDVDGDAIRFSNENSEDGELFVVNASNGVVVANTLDQAFNFEEPQDVDGDNVYRQTITLSDGRGSTSTVITVTITDVNEPPQCTTNPVVGFEENFVGTLVDFNAAAVDPEGLTPTGFSLINLFRFPGIDDETREKFELDTDTGIFSLAESLDAETVGVEGEYSVDVKIDFGEESIECREHLQLIDVVGAVKSGIKFSGRQTDAMALGDIDNDNLTDFWINSPSTAEFDTTQPGGYIVLGSAIDTELSKDGAELFALESLTLNQTIKLVGNYSIPPNRSGAKNTFKVSSIGDVDGDGKGDLIVALEPNPGATFIGLDPDRPFGYILWGDVLLGQTDGQIDLSNLSTSEGMTLLGSDNVSRLQVNANSGDFDGDGVPDLVFAVPEAMTGGDESGDLGEVTVVYGTRLRTAKSAGELDLTKISVNDGVKLTGGEGFYLNAGLSLRSISDLYGDNADELVISTSRGAAVIDSTVFSNATASSGVVRFSDIPESSRVWINLSDEARLSPLSGDADGDGLQDVFVERTYVTGAFAALVSGDRLVNNTPGDQILFDDAQVDENIVLFAHSSERQTDASSMTYIGDIDKDGRDDFGIVYKPIFGEGATYIILAKALDRVGADNTFFIDQMDTGDGVILRNYVAEYSDYRIAALKDTDGDSLPEILIVGAFNQTEGYLVPSSDITAALIAGVAEIDFQENFNDESEN